MGGFLPLFPFVPSWYVIGRPLPLFTQKFTTVTEFIARVTTYFSDIKNGFGKNRNEKTKIVMIHEDLTLLKLLS
jgi:hypothetical protein